MGQKMRTHTGRQWREKKKKERVNGMNDNIIGGDDEKKHRFIQDI